MSAPTTRSGAASGTPTGTTSAASTSATGAAPAPAVAGSVPAYGAGDAPGTAPAADAALWAAMLIRQFPELLTELAPVPGRGRGTAADRPAPGPERLAARSARLREERREALLNEQRHGLAVPGHTASPIRLHVSDAIRDITDGVTELEEAVYDRLRLGRPRRADVPRRLLRLTALLDGVAADAVLAAHVRDELRRMARRCARALGEAETMVRVPGRCPWCDSVSLRAFPASRAVVCVNPGCRCGVPDCDCPTDPAFRHVWEEGSWHELAGAAEGGTERIAARMDEDDRPLAADGPRGGREGGR
ncbi:hypothetical protein [Streptomyces sp. NPDC015131]|uniref:hypothetical protein n=1 Tax=Streptomyces sp. NPDC015131 TaxID=3364941 RepID=UPI0036F9EE86